MSSEIEITGLEDILNNIDKLAISESAKINGVNAAAKIYAEALSESSPETQYDKDGKHLRDLVTFKPNQYPDHSTDVGFSKDGYYYRFVNNGTINQSGQHFMETSYDLSTGLMQEALFNELKKDVDQ